MRTLAAIFLVLDVYVIVYYRLLVKHFYERQHDLKESTFGALLVVSAYVVIYYRLLVRHYYEKHLGVRESTCGAHFSFPPYRVLPEAGKKYARRYWAATAFMVGCVVALTLLTDFSAWRALNAGF